MHMKMAVGIGDVFVSVIKCGKGGISEQRESNPRAGKEIGGRRWIEC